MADLTQLWVRHKVTKQERPFVRTSFERGGFKKHYDIIGLADDNGQFIPGSEAEVPNSKPQPQVKAPGAAAAAKIGEVRAPRLLTKEKPAEKAKTEEAAEPTGIVDMVLQEPDIAPQPAKEAEATTDDSQIPSPPPLPSTVKDVAFQAPAPAEAANDLPATSTAQPTPRRRTPKAQQ